MNTPHLSWTVHVSPQRTGLRGLSKARTGQAAGEKAVVRRILPPCGAHAPESPPHPAEAPPHPSASSQFIPRVFPLLFSALLPQGFPTCLPKAPAPGCSQLCLPVLSSSKQPYSQWSSSNILGPFCPSWTKGEPGGGGWSCPLSLSLL